MTRPNESQEPITRGELEDRLNIFRNSTIENINTRFQLLGEQIISRLDELDNSIKNGFPNGDATEHRKEHERRIKIASEKDELFKSIKEKVITSGIWGLLVLVCLASWEYIKQNINIK